MPVPLAAGALAAVGRAGAGMLAKKGAEEVGKVGLKSLAGQGAKFAAQGSVVGGAAHLTKGLLAGDEPSESKQDPAGPGEPAPGLMPQAQYAGLVGQPMPGQMVPQGYMAPGTMPAMVGGAGVAAVAPQVVATPPATAENSEPERFAGTDDGALKSMGKTAMAAIAGGIGGAVLKHKEGENSPGDLIQGALAGAGTGAFAKMGYEAIQKDGAGLRAGAYTAIAGALGSTLKEGGPDKLSSALMGFGSGTLGNAAHDKLEEAGKHKSADAVAGGGMGGALGYAITGDKSQALLGAGLGGGASVGLGEMDRAGGLGAVLKGDKSPLDRIREHSESIPEQPEASGPQMG